MVVLITQADPLRDHFLTIHQIMQIYVHVLKNLACISSHWPRIKSNLKTCLNRWQRDITQKGGWEIFTSVFAHEYRNITLPITIILTVVWFSQQDPWHEGDHYGWTGITNHRIYSRLNLTSWHSIFKPCRKRVKNLKSNMHKGNPVGRKALLLQDPQSSQVGSLPQQVKKGCLDSTYNCVDSLSARRLRILWRWKS